MYSYEKRKHEMKLHEVRDDELKGFRVSSHSTIIMSRCFKFNLTGEGRSFKSGRLFVKCAHLFPVDHEMM